jgi:hypothetical protein
MKKMNESKSSSSLKGKKNKNEETFSLNKDLAEGSSKEILFSKTMKSTSILKSHTPKFASDKELGNHNFTTGTNKALEKQEQRIEKPKIDPIDEETPKSNEGALPKLESTKSVESHDEASEERLSEIAKSSEDPKDNNFIEIVENVNTAQDSFANNLGDKSTTSTHAERQMSEYLKLQLQESGRDNYRLQAHNAHLQTQMARYEETLSKMNSEYEKLLMQNTSNDSAIFALRKELGEVKTNSQLRINELSVQLKVSSALIQKFSSLTSLTVLWLKFYIAYLYLKS